MTATPFALLNATVFLDGQDISGDTNKISVNPTVEEKDNTTFGSGGWRSRLGGLKDFQLQHSGYVNYGAAGAEDSALFAQLGATNTPVTVSPTGADGATAYFGRATRAMFSPVDASVGDVAAFSGTIDGSDPNGLIRGGLLLPKQSTAATLNGTGAQLGAVGTTQFVYAALHVFAAGTTITVKVQSDDNSGFTSPTDRITFSAITAVGGVWGTRVAGAVTDNWWRVIVSAITGTFSVAAAVGIQ